MVVVLGEAIVFLLQLKTYTAWSPISLLHLVPRLRMSGAITPLPQYASMEWYLIKHRDNFTFYLSL
jgi:hypothetical protein